jgi:hypothetical protein
MIGVVVDIDDTLINTQRRVRKVWSLVLGHEISQETVEALSSRQVLERFAASNQEKWTEFWKILLCSDQSGAELLKLDEAIPFAADVLQRWSKLSTIVYLTGRPDSSRQLTLDELKRFGFPIDGAELTMFRPEDWENFVSVGSLVEARLRVFSYVSGKYDIAKVIDDYPVFFNVYRKFNIPERIGLLRPKRFLPQDYMSQGATRVIESWSQLLDEPPEPKH